MSSDVFLDGVSEPFLSYMLFNEHDAYKHTQPDFFDRRKSICLQCQPVQCSFN